MYWGVGEIWGSMREGVGRGEGKSGVGVEK